MIKTLNIVIIRLLLNGNHTDAVLLNIIFIKYTWISLEFIFCYH